MSCATASKTVAVCDTQPVTIHGLRALLAEQPDFDWIGEAASLRAGLELVQGRAPAVIIVDKTFGLQAVVDWIGTITSSGSVTRAILWGNSITEPEAERALQAGALGILRKTASPLRLLHCLQTVAAGESWMDDLSRSLDWGPGRCRPGLTSRESQVADLVEQGLRNKEIARALGICPGTVKVHLKHIFEKTGVQGRYGLAVSGLKEKGYDQPLIAV